MLRAVEIDPGQVRHAPARQSGGTGGGAPQQLSGHAANALELSVTEAIALGHDYIGCEHLLPALIAEPDGMDDAGRV